MHTCTPILCGYYQGDVHVSDTYPIPVVGGHLLDAHMASPKIYNVCISDVSKTKKL